jgi:acyl-CoA synthetase (NDP forming)
MGVYCPESGFSFCADFSREAGDVGAIIQSGGSSTDVARYGALRGLRFSKLISYGNALDINEMDLLNYLSEDAKTKVIVMF